MRQNYWQLFHHIHLCPCKWAPLQLHNFKMHSHNLLVQIRHIWILAARNKHSLCTFEINNCILLWTCMNSNAVSPSWTLRPSPAFPARSSATFLKLQKNRTGDNSFNSPVKTLNCLHPFKCYSRTPVCCCLLYCWRSCWILVLKKATLAWSCCDWENSKFLYCVKLVL